MLTSDVIGQIESWLQGTERPVGVIAVDGHSAAGKSTFALQLGRRLGAACVPGDDFYRVMDPGARAALTPEQGARRYYDWERMLDETIVPLRAGRRASYRAYDWSLNRLAKHATTIEPAPILVIEGLFVSRLELGDVVDVSVFVAADPQLRRQRQLDRNDATAEWLDRWDAAERWYFDRVRPAASFDLVVHDAPPHAADHGDIPLSPSSK